MTTTNRLPSGPSCMDINHPWRSKGIPWITDTWVKWNGYFFRGCHCMHARILSSYSLAMVEVLKCAAQGRCLLREENSNEANRKIKKRKELTGSHSSPAMIAVPNLVAQTPWAVLRRVLQRIRDSPSKRTAQRRTGKCDRNRWKTFLRNGCSTYSQRRQ